MKTNDNATLAAFDALFARPDLVWVELISDVVELAAPLLALGAAGAWVVHAD